MQFETGVSFEAGIFDPKDEVCRILRSPAAASALLGLPAALLELALDGALLELALDGALLEGALLDGALLEGALLEEDEEAALLEDVPGVATALEEAPPLSPLHPDRINGTDISAAVAAAAVVLGLEYTVVLLE